MRYLAVALLYSSIFLTFPAQAACTPGSAKLPGFCCPTFGQSLMSDDKLNIIACACETTADCTGGYIWKSMTKKSVADIQCAAGQVLTKIKADGTFTCIVPPVKTVTVYNDVYVSPPKPCPELRRSCIDNVGCSGGCFGWFGFVFPESTAKQTYDGRCNGPDRACDGGSVCNFENTYHGTATCDTTTGTWMCSWSSIRTSYKDSWPTGPAVPFGSWSGPCTAISPYS